MCVTKHLAATVRTVRHLKFSSRIAKQERFFIINANVQLQCVCMFFFPPFCLYSNFPLHFGGSVVVVVVV